MKARKPGNPVQVNGNGKTAQGYIAGIGASGALLAGAVVSFVFLVGAVSFEVWPTAAGQLGGDDSLGVAELSGPGAAGSSESSLGEAVSLLAAAVPSDVTPPDAPPKGSGGLEGGGGGSEGGGGTVPGSTGGSVGGSDGSIADTPEDDPDSGNDGGSGGPSNGPGGGNNRPGRDTGNTGTNGSGTATSGTTGSTGSSGGGSGSGGSGGGGSNHSSR